MQTKEQHQLHPYQGIQWIKGAPAALTGQLKSVIRELMQRVFKPIQLHSDTKIHQVYNLLLFH